MVEGREKQWQMVIVAVNKALLLSWLRRRVRAVKTKQRLYQGFMGSVKDETAQQWGTGIDIQYVPPFLALTYHLFFSSTNILAVQSAWPKPVYINWLNFNKLFLFLTSSGWGEGSTGKKFYSGFYIICKIL